MKEMEGLLEEGLGRQRSRKRLAGLTKESEGAATPTLTKKPTIKELLRFAASIKIKDGRVV